MKKSTQHTFIIIFIAILCFSNQACSKKDKVQIELEKVAEGLNMELPMQYDALMRCDSCRTLPNRTFKYYYTFLLSSNSRDTTAFKEKTKSTIVYNIQTSPSMSYMKDNKVTFIYSYVDGNGNKWGEIIITPDDYNKPVEKPQIADNDTFESDNKSVEKKMDEAVESIKKQLPIDLTEAHLSIIDCKVLPERGFGYTYQLHNETSANFDSISYKNNAYQNILKALKKESSTQSFISTLIKEGISLHYVYIDKDGKYLCTIIVKPEDIK